MRRLVVEALALMLVLASLRIGLGQQAPHTTGTDPKAAHPPKTKPPQVKSKLEEMLADALKNNPDIRVAAAKVAEADAELNRTRLLVTQKVIDLHHSMLSQKAAVEFEQKRYQRMMKLAEQGSIDMQLLDEAQQKLTIAKAKLAELEAQLPAVLGKTTRGEGRLTEVARVYPLVGVAELVRTRGGDLELKVKDTQPAAGPLADMIRGALEKPVSVKVGDQLVSEVLADLGKSNGVTFKWRADGLPEPKLNLSIIDLPLRAALQLIEDSEPGYRFVVREYGILFASEQKLPPGALTIAEFLQQKPTGK